MLDLKSELLEACDSPTINKTSEELLGYRDDKINVLGFAYKNEAIEKEQKEIRGSPERLSARFQLK